MHSSYEFLASVGFGLGSEKPSPAPGLSMRPPSASGGIHPKLLHSFHSGSVREVSHSFHSLRPTARSL